MFLILVTKKARVFILCVPSRQCPVVVVFLFSFFICPRQLRECVCVNTMSVATTTTMGLCIWMIMCVCVLLSLCFTREIVVVQLLLLCRVFPSTHSTVSLALFTCTKRVLLTMMASWYFAFGRNVLTINGFITNCLFFWKKGRRKEKCTIGEIRYVRPTSVSQSRNRKLIQLWHGIHLEGTKMVSVLINRNSLYGWLMWKLNKNKIWYSFWKVYTFWFVASISGICYRAVSPPIIKVHRN